MPLDGFFGIWILWNSISAGGAYDAPPDPLGWREGYPSLFLTPSTPSASRSQRIWHQAYLDPPAVKLASIERDVVV